MGLLNSLSIGISGLNVSQNALNITSHNLTNVDTKGFVRQQTLLTDKSYIKWGNTAVSTLQTGLGTDFATVKQVRDSFLDQAYRQESGRQAFYESQSSAISEVESLFGELEGESFQNSMNDFWTSLQELAKQPDSIVARSSLIENSVSFIERADNISKQLSDYQVNLNTQIKDQVNRINEIGKNIKNLNLRIRQYESTGVEQANDLRDERNNLLDELGKIVHITYKEEADSMVNVVLEDVPFVTADNVFQMGTAKMSETSDMLKPIWVTYGGADVFNLDRAPSSETNTDIGSLKGLLTARGSKQATYTDIPLREDYDSDTLYSSAVSDYNNRIDSSVIMAVQAQFDQLIHGITTTINNVLCPNKTVTLSDGKKVQILDEANAPVGMDANNTMGEALFNRKSTSRYSEPQEIEIVNDSGETETITARVYNAEDAADNYSLFTLGEIEVNPNILNNYSVIPLSSNTGSGDYDIKAAGELISKWQDSWSTISPNTLTKHNFNDYYTALVSEIANRGEQLNTISTNQSSMAESIDSQRMEVTGVSSDEELTNLIKYQHAYNASARYVDVVSKMMEDVIEKL